MSIIWRSWLGVSATLAFMPITLGTQVSLQHDATLITLIKQRLIGVAQSTANSFQLAIDLGLTLPMLRNTQTLLDRASGKDANTTHLLIVDDTGNPIGNSPQEQRQALVPAMLRRMRDSTRRWRHETTDLLISGVSLRSFDNALMGAGVIFQTAL